MLELGFFGGAFEGEGGGGAADGGDGVEEAGADEALVLHGAVAVIFLGELDFLEEEGIECLRTNVDALLAKIRKKYKEYGIKETPFVIVKADAGTYGMGIMTVRDPKDLADLNRKTRNKMSVSKDGQEINEVILQEGVPTNERVHDAVAEPVVYMIDRYVVGGFYRVNASRGADENLNSPGASFVPLAFAESDDPERLVPIVFEPDDFMVLVSGDPLRTNAYTFAQNGYLGFPTAKKIELPKDWAERIGKSERN